MPLVTTTEMFKKAYDGGYAIGAFNVNNMEIVQGITEAAQEEKAPLILQVSKGARAYANHTYLVKLVEAAVIECPDIPIALHLDHGPDFETCKACIDGGFTSVMIDASSKPFEENIAITKKVVEYAHDHGVVVEAELGTLAGVEDDVKVSAEDSSYTRPEEVEEFVTRTGCDSLAIAVMDVAKLTEVHMERLVDPHLSGLPAFLVKNPGLNNGFMIPQYVTAGLLGDIALLCAPAAAFNAAVSAGQESPVYRDDTAARQLYQAVQKLRSLVSMTMLTALQAIDLSDHKAMSPVTQKIHDHARQTVTFMENDDLMYQRIEAMEHLVESNQLLADCSVPFTI